MPFLFGGKEVSVDYLWTEVQWAVSQKATTAQLYDVIKSAAAAEGVKIVGNVFSDVTRLRSLAASQRNATEAFGALAGDQGITANLITQDINSRGLADQALAPEFKVVWEHKFTVNGELQTAWRTSEFSNITNMTKNDLLEQLEIEGMVMNATAKEGYAGEFAGIGAVSIRAV